MRHALAALVHDFELDARMGPAHGIGDVGHAALRRPARSTPHSCNRVGDRDGHRRRARAAGGAASPAARAPDISTRVLRRQAAGSLDLDHDVADLRASCTSGCRRRAPRTSVASGILDASA
jgi:hypothetical protein